MLWMYTDRAKLAKAVAALCDVKHLYLSIHVNKQIAEVIVRPISTRALLAGISN
ncbi:hypothetical protein SAMD00019534_061510 [Acytostelium subglobosum LB1]|uniref:hypothetical protein n=1 Tax=Acytostelium subglobosum LB1 TaxID=1410327 RepID=UPI0006450E62|nr:hypothetical protein SAMD00019534_061510 [Acytostelium subglobosum LB1]GAM22976.1 hypothetical protein SAMD00019534_061510 [Acytostelium subglobosum LB1]|eukprot:XP_012754203.1 hypothetical protein SAMD00019534_061510 [Acytostelium subglobosum LB1]